MGGAWGTGLKMLSKNICEGIHLTVKLSAISLQPCKFTKNELLHTYFSRILVRFEIIIYCAFSRNHLMEGCFTFQWGGGSCFSDGGLHFKWGVRPIGGINVDGGVQKKHRMGGHTPHATPLWETMFGAIKVFRKIMQHKEI